MLSRASGVILDAQMSGFGNEAEKNLVLVLSLTGCDPQETLARQICCDALQRYRAAV
jgi:hypothetical protein